MTDIPYRKKETVRQDFDKLANYDTKRDMYYFHRRLKKLLATTPKDKNAVILDFGGGSGLFSLKLQERGYKNLHLLDLSETQCAQAREKGLKNVHCGDENYLIQKFPKNTFDFIFMCDVIEHVESPVDTLRKIQSVLKPTGKLFITYPNPFWVPVLNVLGNIGLKLKGKDNQIYLTKISKKIRNEFYLEQYHGHMLVSKLPRSILYFFESLETLLPMSIKRNICLLNTAVLTPKKS